MNAYQTGILHKAAAGELPEQLAADYTLDELAQCAELIDAGQLDGKPIPNEQGRICSIIHPCITLLGRETLKSASEPLSGEGAEKTAVAKGVAKLQNHPWLAPLIIVAIIIVAVAHFAGALDSLYDLAKKHLGSPTGLPQNSTEYVSRDVKAVTNGLQATLRFARSQPDAPWGRHTVTAELPKQNGAAILMFKGVGSGQYFESSITEDGKSATATYTPYLELSLVIVVSEATKVTLSGNHGLKPVDVKIE